jgi:AcrR family transcriptional regulator
LTAAARARSLRAGKFMQREEKSERSRRQVLDAALQLFSHQGYRATTVREIADAARVSTGNVYHHFPDKESIFRSLLDEFWKITETRRYPFTRALSIGHFPDNIEQLGLAARESIREFRPYFSLIFVDVIEFEGTHIRKFYAELGQRYGAFVGEEALGAMKQRLRPSVSPISALLITARVFFNYFTIEILFNVPEPFGKEASVVIKELSDIVRNGILM